MISFYKHVTGVVMYKDDTYNQTMLFVVERPATNEDIVACPEEYASFLAETTPAPAEPVSNAEGNV
jgi:hypothetical protein